MALAPLIIRWGGDASSDLLRRSARCTRCGNKGADLPASEREVERYSVGFPCAGPGLALMYSPNHGHVSVFDGRHRSSKRVCDEADS
jgi:hypothetical protein